MKYLQAVTEKDVHTEHCCLDHGCKYRDDDCTVATGQKPQSYLCEWCDSDDHEHPFDFFIKLPDLKTEVEEEGKTKLKRNGGFAIRANDWLVQLIAGKRVYFAYYKAPPVSNGEHRIFHSLGAAMRNVIKQAEEDKWS